MTGDEELEEVPAQQFSDWLSQQLDPGLEVVAESLPPAQAVRLGSLVDSDNDGRVSSEELGDGLYTLRFRDLDDDQTFSVSELLPFRDPRNQQAP